MTHHDPDANVTMPQGTEDYGRGGSNNGGSAFPCPVSEQWERNQDGAPYQSGMTLRQWYAGQALVGIATDAGFAVPAGMDWPAFAAQRAFQMADAMIAFEAQEGGEK